MERKEELKNGFDAYADEYSRVIAEGARASGESYEYMVALRVALFAAQVAGLVRPGAEPPALLDFGCGTGCTIASLAGRFPGATLHGFDSSAQSVAVAAARQVPGATFRHGERCPLPYPDGSFDLVYSNGTFHHIPEAERLPWLRELRRVLKPGGALVVFENNPFNPLMMQAMKRTPFDADASPVAARALGSLLRRAGFLSAAPYYYFFFPRWLKWCRVCEPWLRSVPIGAQYLIKATRP